MTAKDQKDIQMAIHLNEGELNIILEAVEKNMPKKVIDDFAHGLYGSCPSCFTIRSFGENYCSHCGQKIYFEVKKDAKQRN